MPLTVLSSNRVEALQTRLALHLAAHPLRDPFAPEQIVVPTFAMGRWLNLRIAEQQGIAANIDYPLAGDWVWRLATELLDEVPARDPYSGNMLCWQIFELLPKQLGRPPFAMLQKYLAEDTSGIKRWQLSQRIGASFDRYQAYRPQLIREWCEGESNDWQACLWRALLERGGKAHRGETLTRLIEILDAPAPGVSLPERLSLFAISSLAPLYLDLLNALATHTQINFYLHCPTDQYWADLDNEKSRARRRLENPEDEALFETGNELLASWGRQGQVFQDLLLSRADPEIIDIDLYSTPDGDSLLEKIQHSIFTLGQDPGELPVDDSIAVHVCHSAMRECQVLQDQVLSMLQDDLDLHAEEILVMVPDIAAYAPYIEAVFQRGPVAFNISDITLADEHPLVTAFLSLLDLPNSRFTSSEILALLDNEAIRHRFDIDENALDEIHRLIGQAHTRWGIDASHKTSFDLPPTDGNTWQQLRDRYFAGYALADGELWQGIAPLPARDDSNAAALGRFWHFFARLRAWRARLDAARPAAQWRELLARLVDEFFVEPDPREARLQQIRDAIGELPLELDTPIGHALLNQLVGQLLGSREQSGQLYSGGITFCGMRPMRSIPFKVICVLGLNRADFPRRDPESDFEIMSSQRIAGDPSSRVEDRYLMLETLLCARQKLYLSYTGRSLRDNSEQQPSVLLQELLDFIDARFASAGDETSSAGLTRLHPMQVFGDDNYRPPRRCYQQYWAGVASDLQTRTAESAQGWPRRNLPAAETPGFIDLARLRRFVVNPVQFFFQQRLDLYLRRDELPDDDETFDLNALEQWRLKQQLAGDRLAGRDQSVARLQAEGLLAHGIAARLQVAALEAGEADWFDALEPFRGIESRRLNPEIEVGRFGRLGGGVAGYYPDRGLMQYHPGRFKGRLLLGLWIDHLALCAAKLLPPRESSLLLCRDRSMRIEPLAPNEAAEQLADYCELLCEGITLPLPVLPDGSFTWASEADRDKARTKVLRPWLNQYAGGYGGDPADPYLQLVLRNRVDLPLTDPRFDDYARRLYTRLLAASQVE